MLLDKAEKFYDEGMIEEAFICLNRAYDVKKSIGATLLYAKLYYEIGDFDYAVQKCYEIKLDKSEKTPDILYETATLLFKINFFEGRFDLADECFSELKEIEESSGFEYKDDYDFDGIDAFLDYYKNDYNAFRVIDKNEEATKEMLKDAFDRIAIDDYSGAARLLKDSIDTAGSSQHNMLMMCYINLHKYKQAEKLAEKMLQNEDTKFLGMLNMINIGVFKKDSVMRDKYTEMLSDCPVDDEDDIEKAVATMILANDHAMVEKFTCKLLDIRPYDMENLYYLACAYYCQGKKSQAKQTYKKIYDIYGENSRAQFFLRYCEKDMTVYYNSPLPFEYFGILSNMFESVARGAGLGELLENSESRELIYLALMIEELRNEVFIYLSAYLEEPSVCSILKRFFLDINIVDEFKEFAAKNMIINSVAFDFEYISRDRCGRFCFDGKNDITDNASINSAYVHLILRLLFRSPDELKNIDNYKSLFVTLGNAINDIIANDKDAETPAVKNLSLKNEKAAAAAVYFRANYMQKKQAGAVARLFDTSAAMLGKYLQIINTEILK
jgi:tetratricopeptide (TPR) repeat protein